MDTPSTSVGDRRPVDGRRTSGWPLDRSDIPAIIGSFLVIVAAWTVAGLTLTDWLAPNPITRFDARLAERFVERRTPFRDDLATWGSFLSNTMTKIVVTTLLVAAAYARWRRWHEALLVAFSLIFEVCCYGAVGQLVARQRPAVDRLVDSAVDKSFPSGHVAAATVYLALAVIVFWHTRSVWWRALAIAAGSAVAVIVAVARMYQGMHFLSDVIAGALLGLMTLFVTTRLIQRPPALAGHHD